MESSNRSFIITSAAYVGSEIAAEFGRLPPSFLPYGHDRLYMRQVALAKKLTDNVILSLPADFAVPQGDDQWLHDNGVQILQLPPGLSLVRSIKQAIALAGIDGPLSVLHGDTLFLSELPLELDVVSIERALDNYEWGAFGENGRYLTGYFSLSSATTFLHSALLSDDGFPAAIQLYSERKKLTGITISGWLDFGHLQRYYQSRLQVTTSRSFNCLTMDRLTVRKGGSKPEKIRDESLWFERLPSKLRLNIPTYLGTEQDGTYSLAYEASPTLHELFVYGNVNKGSWRKIMSSVQEFLEQCCTLAIGYTADGDLDTLLTTKTMTRMHMWLDQEAASVERRYGGKVLPSLTQIVEECVRIAGAENALPGIMHGDLCFPNMFFDFRNQLIKLIDPRGSVRDGDPSCFGDIRYDIAKLNHSIEGYDHILAGRYRLDQSPCGGVSIALANNPERDMLVDIASDFEVAGRPLRNEAAIAGVVLLFLSMIPLHADRPDRQKAFLANALRLYCELEQGF